MARGKTEKLGNILRNVLSRRAIAGNFQIRQVQRTLDGILTPEENGHIRAGAIRNGCLIMMVDSPAMIYELEAFRSHELIDRLREAGHGDIRKVRFEFEERRK